MIVVDASVLIAHLDSEDLPRARADSLLIHEIDDDFAASTVTLAEVLVMPARRGRLDAAREALTGLDVQEPTLPADSAVTLAQLRAGTGLKVRDCCVLLVAEDVQTRVASFDDRRTEVAASRNLVVVAG